MKKFAAVALVPLFASFLFAQTNQTTQTQTTTTTTNRNTWNGMLVDAGCRTTHTENRESSTSTPDANTTHSESSHTTTDSTECPVTTTTTSFALLTRDGKYIQFDPASNTKIVETVKHNKKWTKYMTEKQPIQVQVVGTPNGNVVVMDTIR
jgi:hypothetical protein